MVNKREDGRNRDKRQRHRVRRTVDSLVEEAADEFGSGREGYSLPKLKFSLLPDEKKKKKKEKKGKEKRKRKENMDLPGKGGGGKPKTQTSLDFGKEEEEGSQPLSKLNFSSLFFQRVLFNSDVFNFFSFFFGTTGCWHFNTLTPLPDRSCQ